MAPSSHARDASWVDRGTGIPSSHTLSVSSTSLATPLALPNGRRRWPSPLRNHDPSHCVFCSGNLPTPSSSAMILASCLASLVLTVRRECLVMKAMQHTPMLAQVAVRPSCMHVAVLCMVEISRSCAFIVTIVLCRCNQSCAPTFCFFGRFQPLWRPEFHPDSC